MKVTIDTSPHRHDPSRAAFIEVRDVDFGYPVGIYREDDGYHADERDEARATIAEAVDDVVADLEELAAQYTAAAEALRAERLRRWPTEVQP